MVKMLMGPIVLLKQCEVIYVYATYTITFTNSNLASMVVLLWIQSQELIFKIMFYTDWIYNNIVKVKKEIYKTPVLSNKQFRQMLRFRIHSLLS